MEGNRKELSMTKNVGVFEGKIVAINPSKEQLEMLLNTTLEKDVNYTSTKTENDVTTPTLRLSIWLEDVASEKLKNVSFFIEARHRVNKDGNKYQYVNQVGRTSWGEISKEGSDLPNFFTHFLDKNKNVIGDCSYRQAFVGEEELMNFIRSWLNFDYYSPETNIMLDWTKIFAGNFKELRDAMQLDAQQTVMALATVRIVTDAQTEEVKEYQSIYNKDFLPGYHIKMFRATKYTPDRVEVLKTKENKKLAPHERFIINVTDGQYGCKDRYTLEELKDYNPEEFFENTGKVLSSDDLEY